MPLDPKSTKVIAKKGAKDPSYISSGNKSRITVVGCVSAAGISIPPMILFERQTLHADMARGEIPGTYYGLNSGWMNQELFEDWLKCHFLRYAPPVRPLLLLLDGHNSHYNPSAVRVAIKEKVILFTLPPHTTHITQPLDRGCFGPLKTAWRSSCHEFMRNNPGKVITKFSFNAVFSNAYKKSMSMENIISSFRATGIYPLDRSKVLEKPCIQKASLAEESGIAFLPLFSARSSDQGACSPGNHFTMDEMDCFHDRYVKETRKPDEVDRYSHWKKVYHPLEDKVSSSSTKDPFLATPTKATPISKQPVVAKPHCSIKHMFKPPPVLKRPELSAYKSSRCLTSGAHLEMMEEKEKQKEEKERKKKERAELQEQKKKEKEEMLQQKKKEREAQAELRKQKKKEKEAQVDCEKKKERRKKRSHKARKRSQVSIRSFISTSCMCI